MDLFGFQFSRKVPQQQESIPSFTPGETDDGAVQEEDHEREN